MFLWSDDLSIIASCDDMVSFYSTIIANNWGQGQLRPSGEVHVMENLALNQNFRLGRASC